MSKSSFFHTKGGSMCVIGVVFFFQAEDGIRYLVRSRGLGDVYKRQPPPQPLVSNCEDKKHSREYSCETVDIAGESPVLHLSLIHI